MYEPSSSLTRTRRRIHDPVSIRHGVKLSKTLTPDATSLGKEKIGAALHQACCEQTRPPEQAPLA